MDLENAIIKIQNFDVNDGMEDYEISEFFDAIGDELTDVKTFTSSQKQQLIQVLFDFLKRQDPELEENFSFIHFIEHVDKPDYKIYDAELLKFNTENGTTTATLLLNRFINGLKEKERKKYIDLLKVISENRNYTDFVRVEALSYYEHQMEKG
ncbi:MULTISPECIES: hypothetical protein [unclassified Olleya]|uniref:hypothetical protein n=1 Tax=unclassified Olleya TaxID=2615019 RepID=UPI000C3102C5|nr:MULTISPECIES: hypothetical protein [unclassified Olleya]AUC77615.1 hypothetical protein CW732_18790 [Olleya sp. Bg11-27]QXP59976.1 hypothetical protein H0I26_19055 [Olleya sp. HaHaR_3_96]